MASRLADSSQASPSEPNQPQPADGGSLKNKKKTPSALDNPSRKYDNPISRTTGTCGNRLSLLVRLVTNWWYQTCRLTVLAFDQSPGREGTPFWALFFFFRGSVSVARVTSLFLAVTGFREALFNILDINTVKGWLATLHPKKKKCRTCSCRRDTESLARVAQIEQCALGVLPHRSLALL